jgi:hypothetical protein
MNETRPAETVCVILASGDVLAVDLIADEVPGRRTLWLARWGTVETWLSPDRDEVVTLMVAELCARRHAVREVVMPGEMSRAESAAVAHVEGAEAMRADISATLDARADRLGKSTLPREGDIAAVFAEAAAIARGVPVRSAPVLSERGRATLDRIRPRRDGGAT